MKHEYYPWGGEFTACSNKGCVAVVLLNIVHTPPESVAIYGPLKTENIGIEKIVANVISNPNIRYVIICGDDIRGHRSGSSLVALHENGIDEQHKIIEAPGAIPYIENLKIEALKRFQDQVEIINFIGVTNKEKIDNTVNKYTAKSPPSYGEPYIAIRIKTKTIANLDDKRALHSRIVLNYIGKVIRRGK